jgi:hypothetical protein
MWRALVKYSGPKSGRVYEPDPPLQFMRRLVDWNCRWAIFASAAAATYGT